MDSQPTDPSPMVAVLAAPGPHPTLGNRSQLFGQFVGGWHVDIVYYTPEGGVRRKLSGEWHFGWVLEGRAIQDVWIAPRRSQRGVEATEEYGATLRFYDPQIDAWRSTWIGPVKGMVRPFLARQRGDEIVLEGSFEEGAATRWIFSAITPETFRWRAVESRDGWQTEHLEQEMFAQRIGPAA